MIAKNINLIYTYEGDMQLHLTVDRNQQLINKVAELKKTVEKGKMLDFEVKPYRKKRSLDANAMCWIMADKIAQVIESTKENVYREIIKRVGIFEIVPIRNDAVDRWISSWNTKGIGWISEVLSDSKLEGYTNTINYYGSSVYDTKEMSILLNELVEQAKELGIETMTDREKELLIAQWKGEC